MFIFFLWFCVNRVSSLFKVNEIGKRKFCIVLINGNACNILIFEILTKVKLILFFFFFCKFQKSDLSSIWFIEMAQEIKKCTSFFSNMILISWWYYFFHFSFSIWFKNLSNLKSIFLKSIFSILSLSNLKVYLYFINLMYS